MFTQIIGNVEFDESYFDCYKKKALEENLNVDMIYKSNVYLEYFLVYTKVILNSYTVSNHMLMC